MNMNMNSSAIIDQNNNRRIGPFSLNSLFANFPDRTAKKGEVIAKQNHSLGYIYYLVEGMVKTIRFFPKKRKEVVNGYFTSGDIMNLEIWNKDQTVSPILKITSSKVIYKIIPINDFRAMVLQNHGLNQLILRTLIDKMNKNNVRLHRLLLSKSKQRVIQFLLDYVGEIGQRVGYEYVIKKPFTHEEMGNLSDSSRQTVTTVLNELKAKNLIHFTRRYILIRDLDGLLSASYEEDA